MSKQSRRKQQPKPVARKHFIHPSPAVFENAFHEQIGQTPLEWVKMKVDGGLPLDSIRYLFQVTASAGAKEYDCVQQDFEKYYHQYLKSQEKKPVCQKVSKPCHKLVRDRIPGIIEASGGTCICKVLSEEAYISMLDKKLNEELAEYQESKSLEELADLLEVMGAVVKARGYTWDQLTAVRKKRLEERGGFEKRILLVEVTEENAFTVQSVPKVRHAVPLWK